MKGGKPGHFCVVADMSIVAVGCLCSAVDTRKPNFKCQYYDLGKSLQILWSYTLLLKPLIHSYALLFDETVYSR